METIALTAVKHKYLQRFIATFIAENRHTTKRFKIDFDKASFIIISIIYLKSGYKPEKEDLYNVFKRLRYTISYSGADSEIVFPLGNKLYLDLDLVQVETLAKLLKHLTGQVTKCDQRVLELNLQLDLFNKLHHIRTIAA